MAAEPRTAGALRFEPLSSAHVAAVERLIVDPETLRFTRVPEPPPEGFARTWIERYETGIREGVRAGFAALGEDGSFLGMALAPHIDAEEAEVELGYIVAPEARGRGVATEMLRRLTTWAFEEAGALRAYLIIDVDNGASMRAAERCGYVREGVLRSVHVKEGRRADVTLWSRLPGDA